MYDGVENGALQDIEEMYSTVDNNLEGRTNGRFSLSSIIEGLFNKALQVGTKNFLTKL